MQSCVDTAWAVSDIKYAIKGRPQDKDWDAYLFWVLNRQQQRMVIVPDEDVLTGACEPSGLLHGPDCHRNMRRVAEELYLSWLS